jgi:hypothetical protein
MFVIYLIESLFYGEQYLKGRGYTIHANSFDLLPASCRPAIASTTLRLHQDIPYRTFVYGLSFSKENTATFDIDLATFTPDGYCTLYQGYLSVTKHLVGSTR